MRLLLFLTAAVALVAAPVFTDGNPLGLRIKSSRAKCILNLRLHADNSSINGRIKFSTVQYSSVQLINHL
jgi:hypothetical protein